MGVVDEVMWWRRRRLRGVQILRLEPGDWLSFASREKLTRASVELLREQLREQLREAFSEHKTVVALGIDVSVIRGPDAIEGTCEKCGRKYPVWFAPSELWNAVVRGGNRAAPDEWALLCLDCFALTAEERGRKPTAWMLVEEPWDDDTRQRYLLPGRTE